MAIGSDNPFPSILLQEHVDPATPPSGHWRLFVDTDNILKLIDDAGTVSAVGGGASYATPAIVLGSSAAAGAASTVIRSDSTIAAFDATVPVTQAFSDSAATGSAAFAARRDHKHGMPASPGGGGLAQSFVGYNTIGGTWTTVTAGRVYTKKVTLSATSNFQSVDVYVRASTDNFSPIYAGLLTDNSNVPDLLIATASAPPLLLSTAATGGPWTGHWLSIPIGANVASGDYWLAVAFPSAAFFDIANDGSGSDVYWGLTGAYMSGSHSSLSKTTSAFKYSIRASILS